MDSFVIASTASPASSSRANRLHPVPRDHDRPGLFLFEADGNLTSLNEDAHAWLAELPPHEPGIATDHGVVPVWLFVTAQTARAIVEGTYAGAARTRVQSTRRGRWLTCDASCLRQPDGSVGPIAVIVEAAQASAIAPIIVEAYGLTDREHEIVRLIARGSTTSGIAEELLLSPHTVRDHIKAIFAKVEVSSRGVPTAKLFADFYEPVKNSGHIHVIT